MTTAAFGLHSLVDPGTRTAIATIPVDTDSTPGSVVRRIAESESYGPWALSGAVGHDALLVSTVSQVLAGEAEVFGLVGVVATGADGADSLRRAGLPVEIAADEPVDAAVARLRDRVRATSPAVPVEWGRVIASSRVDPAMRAVLARRALPDDVDYAPEVLTVAQLATLRALADRLVPQNGPGRIDLAARVDRMLARGEGDGWRPLGAPRDADAYRVGLDAIARRWHADEAGQDEVIETLMSDGIDAEGLSPALVTSWFEDARNDLARVWLSHPASLARVGYSGFATGGTGPEPVGYSVLAAGEREAWEPAELGRSAGAAR